MPSMRSPLPHAGRETRADGELRRVGRDRLLVDPVVLDVEVELAADRLGEVVAREVDLAREVRGRTLEDVDVRLVGADVDERHDLLRRQAALSAGPHLERVADREGVYVDDRALEACLLEQ